jgi:hypothetical protein
MKSQKQNFDEPKAFKRVKDIFNTLQVATNKIQTYCSEINFKMTDINSDFMTKIRNDIYIQSDQTNYKLYVNPKMKISKNLYNFSSIAYYWSLWSMLPYYNEEYIKELLEDKNFKSYNYFTNSIQFPFTFLTADHTSKSIVIAIRGTFSPVDMISDVLGALVPFLEGEENIMAHAGFANAAINIFNLLIDDLYKLKTKYPTYNIKIVGHSYGAGVASVLSTILNYENKSSERKLGVVKAILYECPPVYNRYWCERLCEEGTQVTFILMFDIVSRASINNVRKFICKVSEDIDIDRENAYVPGNIYWLVYDFETKKYDGIYKIKYDNPCLDSIFIHPHCLDDHSLSRVCGFLYGITLGSLKQEHQYVEENEILEGEIDEQQDEDLFVKLLTNRERVVFDLIPLPPKFGYCYNIDKSNNWWKHINSYLFKVDKSMYTNTILFMGDIVLPQQAVSQQYMKYLRNQND